MMCEKICRIWILVFLMTGFLVSQAQTTQSNEKALQAKLYNQAITEFINAANKKNKTNFDTLFILLRKNGLPDDFPDVTLSERIQNTHIRLIAPGNPQTKSNRLKKRIYINLFGWIEKENAEFMFVVFSNGLSHQYDYTIRFKKNKGSRDYTLDKLQFSGPPFGK